MKAPSIYVLKNPLIGFLLNQNQMDKENRTLELTPINEDSEPFQVIFNPFLKNILQKDILENSALDPEENLSLIGVYKSLHHPNSSAHFFRQLKHAPNQETARCVFDSIKSWEIRRSGHSSKKEAIDCILNQAKDDIELQNWILNMLDWGFFANLKLWLKNMLPKVLLSNSFLTKMNFFKSAVQTFLFYWDLFKDVATYAIFNHMTTNILVSTRTD